MRSISKEDNIRRTKRQERIRNQQAFLDAKLKQQQQQPFPKRRP